MAEGTCARVTLAALSRFGAFLVGHVHSPRVTRTVREILNELRWRERDRLAEATLLYRDRARPEGFRVILGSEIVSLERRYFTTASAGRLPYYKIERVEVSGRVVFERPG